MVNWKLFWQKQFGKNQNRPYIGAQLSIAKDIDKIIKKYNYKTILDVGCGPALIIKALAKKYPNKRFTGYDVSGYVITQNKKDNLKNLHFKIIDLNKIPTKQKFDLVLCLSTLHYFIGPLMKIKKLLKLVNKNGSLIVNYPNRELLQSYYNNEEKLDYWKRRFELMFQKRNLITLKLIKQLGHICRVIRQKQTGNKYVQIMQSRSVLHKSLY